MMSPEPGVDIVTDLDGAVIAMMSHGSELDLEIATVLVVYDCTSIFL
jgi:hypothetical protein